MYYRLTYTASADRERMGDAVLNGTRPLSIGQGPACDVQLPDSAEYEPQVYATLLWCEERTGWILVRRTDCHRLQVNGTEVPIAQALRHGDRLTFDDGPFRTELKFEVQTDGEYDAASGLVYRKHSSHRAYYLATVLLAAMALGTAAYTLLRPRQASLSDHTDRFRQSVYQVIVDSVYLLCDSVVDGVRKSVSIGAVELADVAAGTAFLARDGEEYLFVTARHCIEPWMDDVEWDARPDLPSMPPEIQLALRAETGNRAAGYEKYTLRSHCIISMGLERYDCYSTDFFMNKSRDLVMRLDAAQGPVYWRTIFPIARRRDMELGDFAYLRADGLGGAAHGCALDLAEWADIQAFCKSKAHEVAVVGYPLNDNGEHESSVVYGHYSGQAFSDLLPAPTGCLQHSAPINRGNSGGPVVALIGDAPKVVGIVSKADSRASQGLFWAVPVAEVLNMHRQGDRTDEDSVTYRR